VGDNLPGKPRQKLHADDEQRTVIDDQCDDPREAVKRGVFLFALPEEAEQTDYEKTVSVGHSAFLSLAHALHDSGGKCFTY